MSVEAAAIAALGFVITVLLSIVGFFGIRMLGKLDSTSGKLDSTVEKLAEFGADLRVIANAIKLGEARQSDFAREVDQRLSEQNDEIHLLRTRTHTLLGYVTALRLKAELHGWEFKGDAWSLSNDERAG